MLLRIVIILLLITSSSSAESLKNCEWSNKKGVPCLTVSKTPNTSAYSDLGINKIIITKQDIINSGAIDTVDVFQLVSGLDVFQSGPKGQSTSISTRGADSNHTLVMINGIAINDQSVTDGQHDFGQDFIQTIQQIEIYKGSGGAHFGPSAIAGAINFITTIDYTNSYSVNGFNRKNNSFEDLALFLGYVGLLGFVFCSPIVLILSVTGVENLSELSIGTLFMVFCKGLFDNVLSDLLWAKAVILTSPTVSTKS